MADKALLSELYLGYAVSVERQYLQQNQCSNGHCLSLLKYKRKT